MAGKRMRSEDSELIHVYDDIYLGYDELNMIVKRKKVSKKTKKVSFVSEGFFISGKALLSRLYDSYMLARVKDGTIVKPEALVGIENFINKVEKAKLEFERISKWK